jgi:hypothetical protein
LTGVWNQNLFRSTSNLSLNEKKAVILNSGLIDNCEVFDLECILLASKAKKIFLDLDSLQEFFLKSFLIILEWHYP